MTKLSRIPAIVVTFAALVALTGCASVDFDYPKVESVAISETDTTETYLGKQVAELVAEHPEDESGFYAVYDGNRRMTPAQADYSFVSAPLVGRPEPARFWVVGDSGTGQEPQKAVYQAMPHMRIAFPG